MKSLQVSFEKGWHEAIIDEDCGFDKFYRAAGILENELNIVFINKIDDFDSLYWDFKIDDHPPNPALSYLLWFDCVSN